MDTILLVPYCAFSKALLWLHPAKLAKNVHHKMFEMS